MLKRNTLTTLSAAIFAWFGACCVVAAPNDSEPEIWYQVEVIIFARQDPYGTEQPRRDIHLSYPKKVVELVNPDVQEVADQAPSSGQETGAPLLTDTLTDSQPQGEKPFIQLDRSERSLNPDATAIDRQPQFRVLYHQAWRQPGIDSSQAPWVLVRGGERYGQHFELEGSIRLWRSRYRHFEANLWLSKFDNNFGQQPEDWPPLPAYPVINIPEPESEYTDENFSLELPPESVELGVADGSIQPGFETETQVPYLISEIQKMEMSRRMKPDEIHYLDHHRMGIVVNVTTYEVPQPKKEEETSAVPLMLHTQN
ncbi:CsiV family protein [Porticoccaceae bacterium LTM1]|nr:CsiV family protein [Porticoccaceae bacterium LTM1]